MSDYSDAMNDNLVNELEKKFLDRMKCEINDSLFNQSRWKILLICLLLIIVYCSIFVMLFSQMRSIHSQHEYFQKNFKIEREKLNEMKENLFEFEAIAENNLFKTDRDCYECWYSLYKLDYKSIFSYMKMNNEPIKRSYHQTLYPLQRLLIILAYGNTHLMLSIYIEPFRLLFISVLLFLINLCVYAELFIVNTPNVYYTLVIGICIFLFSFFLLSKIVMDLLSIVNYQKMEEILQKK